MRDCRPAEDAAGPGLSHRSSAIEKVLEYHFLAAITGELMRRGAEFEVLRSDVDAGGHDLVIEANGVLRHIQLKAMIRGGQRADISVNSKLARKASGCVIWMTWDPASFQLGPFRWFGGEPGCPLPSLGEKTARHSKGNGDGEKTIRPAHRILGRGKFKKLESMGELVDRLFGDAGETAQ